MNDQEERRIVSIQLAVECHKDAPFKNIGKTLITADRIDEYLRGEYKSTSKE